MSEAPQSAQPPTAAFGEDHPPTDSAAELVRVLDQYLADLQTGRAPERAQLLAAHPELAGQLEQCLAGIEFVHQAARPAREAPACLGDFRIIREVGRGGMGVVYEAEQHSLKRRVALKVLRFGAVADADAMQRFQREAETVARLHHTNIVPIFAVGCEQGVHYYAMQFIEGRSLAAVLEEMQAAPARSAGAVREVARWGLQAAEALAHAHQRGVIHRDIKPSNLLLDPEGVLWLTDFGLAKRADELTLTLTGLLVGTPRYMSPEQAAAVNRPVDHRTDIYSLGATLYELATGRPVFDAPTPQAVLAQIQHDEPTGLRRLQPTLPRDLETIILKCLAKEPARRYATAAALADDLRAFLDGRAIKGRRPSLAERAGRWVRKQRRSAMVAAVAATVAVVLMIGGIIGWNSYQEAQLGYLTLTTTGQYLRAEVLDAQDQLVVPSFTVPTEHPVAIPGGSYRVRLSAPSRLSETYELLLDRGWRLNYHLGLEERNFTPDSAGLAPAPTGDHPVAEDLKLDFKPVNVPQWVELSSPAVVLLRRQTEGKLELQVRSVPANTPLWQKPLNAYWPVQSEHPPEWPMVADLAGDRTPVLIVPTFDPVDEFAGELGVEVLDAANGALRWRQHLCKFLIEGGVFFSSSRWTQPVDKTPFPIRLRAGPDIDGDGCRDVFAVSLSERADIPRGRTHLLMVQALSGRDGRPLWRWIQPLPAVTGDQLGAPRWWRNGGDGWPELVVPYTASSYSDRQPSVAYVLSAGTGQLRQTISEFKEPMVADLDNDGVPDLAAWEPTKYDGIPRPRRLQAIRGAPVEAWRRLDNCKPAADYDGDGLADLVWYRSRVPGQLIGTTETVRAVISGRDGSVLWRFDPADEVGPDHVTALSTDLDGDGVPDLLLDRRLEDGAPLAALSGRTGKRLWTARGLSPGTQEDHVDHFLWKEARALGSDGRPAIVCAYLDARGSEIHGIWKTASRQQHWLAVLDGSDGQVRWKIRIGPEGDADAARNGGFSPEVELSPVAFADLDGDGTLDLVFWLSETQGPGAAKEHKRTHTLYAVSGSEGRPLWTWRAPARTPLAGEVSARRMPRPTIVDLNGTGAPGIVFMLRGQAASPSAGTQPSMEVLALNGTDGALRWRWHGDGAAPNGGSQWDVDEPPVLIRLAGGRFIGAHADRFRRELVLLDIRGQEVQRRRFDHQERVEGLGARDLDGDGHDELLVRTNQRLLVTHGGVENLLWEWTWPKGFTERAIELDFLPGGKESMVVARSERAVYGLAGPTGQPRWRCDGPGKVLGVLRNTDGGGLPRVVYSLDGQATVCRLARPIDADGKYQDSPIEVKATGPLAASSLVRTLPWVEEVYRIHTQLIVYLFFLGWSAYRTAAAFAVLILAGGALFWAVCRRSWKLTGAGLLLLALAATLLFVKYDAHCVKVTLKYIIPFGIPPLVFLAVLAVAVFQRRWRWVGRLLVASIILSVAVGLVWLWYDFPSLESWEHYTWAEWYLLWLWGAWVGGAALIVWPIVGWLYRNGRRLLTSHARVPLAT